MKFVLVFVAVVGLVLGESFFYTTENDYIDIDSVIADLPSLQSFVDCFLEKGPCNSFTESVRRNLQESVIRTCDRCNAPQRERFAKFLKGLKAKLPHEYIAFRQKYDPNGIFFDALEFELAKSLPHDVLYSSWSPYYYLYK